MFNKFFGAVFGSYANTAMSVVKWGLIASIFFAVSTSAWKFYNHYTELNTTITNQAAQMKKQESDIAFLRGEKETLEQQLKDQKGSEELTDKIALELDEKQQTSKDAIGSVVEERKVTEEKLITKKTVTVKKSTPSTVKGKADTVEKVDKVIADADIPDELSKIRINSIWKSYCSSNRPRAEDVEQCKIILKPD